jgi:hypothetical protein
LLPILRYAYPEAEIPFKPVLASYAVGVALNGFLPANIGITTATTAAAYSLGQQLIVTAWNQVFAIVLLVSAFGWSGGKQLVRDS